MDFGLPRGGTHLVSLITVLPCRRGLYREKHMLFCSILLHSILVKSSISCQNIDNINQCVWRLTLWNVNGWRMLFLCVIAYWIMNSFVQWYLSQDTCCTRTHMWFLIFVSQLLMCRKISFSLRRGCRSKHLMLPQNGHFHCFFSKGLLRACSGVVFAIVFNNVSNCEAALGWQTQQCAPLKRL